MTESIGMLFENIRGLIITTAIAGAVVGTVLGVTTGLLRIFLDLLLRLVKLIFKGIFIVLTSPFKMLLKSINERNISQLPPELRQQQPQYTPSPAHNPETTYVDEQQRRRVQELAREINQLSRERQEREASERVQRDRDWPERKVDKKTTR